jgi:GH15 family glucan-1,4-alpha-glucosidase
MRDAAFTIYAFLRIGFAQEARAFMQFLQERSMEPDGYDYPLQPLYGIDGRHIIEEETLDHLDGYMGSKPVRIGNAAYKQFQLDIYGELMDAAYLYNKYGSFISHDIWMQLHRLLDWVCDNWERTDQGVWEVRVEPTHFVYSKVMCWVALDRGIRIADKRALPANRPRLERVRDEIYNDIMENGWHEERGAFVQRYGDDALDAANLIMPLVYFVTADDPRMLSTIEAILKPLNEGGLAHGTMIYRYNVTKSPDGLTGDEGTFNMCSFWLVEALTRAGRTEEARLIFERMMGHTNHLGLFAEQTGKYGEALGNFPQAFTHLSFISAVFNLNRDT